jgi:hypothetical protein
VSVTEHTNILAAIEKELDSNPLLLEELNDKFQALDGVKDSTEFSRCVVFFLLGRVYERLYGPAKYKN